MRPRTTLRQQLLLLLLTLYSSPQNFAAAARSEATLSTRVVHATHSPPYNANRTAPPLDHDSNSTKHKSSSSSSSSSSSKRLSSPASRSSKLSQKTHQRSNPVNVTRISVIGERHSGTNFMWRLLHTNLSPHINVSDIFCDFKHRYQLPGQHCPDLQSTLVVVMFRNPYDWALAMRDYCWCGSKELAERVHALSLASFLQLPWHDSMKRRDEVAGLPSGDVVGLAPDRSLQGEGEADSPSLGEGEGGVKAHNPDTVSCDNILQCRARKLHNFLNISRWAPNVEFVRHEDVITPHQSLSWLSGLITRYQLPQANHMLHPIEDYKRRTELVFNAESAKQKSLWFNPDLATRGLPLLREYRADVTRLADRAAEASVGYTLDGQKP